MTSEHVPPTWVEDLLRPLLGPLGARRQDPRQGIYGPFNAALCEPVPVCEPCNRWMNEYIEEPARDVLKPLMLGARTITKLSRTQQMHVATWIVKTLTLMSFLPNRGSTEYTGPEIRNIHDAGAPSSTTTVWIGQLDQEIMPRTPGRNAQPKPELYESVVIEDGWVRTGRV
jgi:hypothetical protein